MPSFRDIAHDGALRTFSNRPGQVVWSVKAGGMYKILSSQPGGPPCWASPLVFGLIGTGTDSEGALWAGFPKMHP